MIFIGFQLGMEKPRPWLGCDNVCPFKLRTVGGEMLRSMVMANATEIMGTMDLAMSVSLAIMASHPRIINSIMIIEGFFRWGTRISRKGCNGGFRVFLFNERGRRWCVRPG
jgi:hypothetical protein